MQGFASVGESTQPLSGALLLLAAPLLFDPQLVYRLRSYGPQSGASQCGLSCCSHA